MSGLLVRVGLPAREVSTDSVVLQKGDSECLDVRVIVRLLQFVFLARAVAHLFCRLNIRILISTLSVIAFFTFEPQSETIVAM